MNMDRIGRIIAAVVFGFLGAAFLAVSVRAGGGKNPSLRVMQDDKTLTILAGNQQILLYQQVESPQKPYVKRLFSPAGVQILLDAPSDHKHHHALMFALAADSINFWEEAAASGRQRHRSLQVVKAKVQKGVAHAGFIHHLEWADSSGKPLLLEQRTVLAYRASNLPATLLTWRSKLEPAPGREFSVLSGSHYFGLGMRFIESMDRGGRFINSEAKEGELVRGSERLTAARWCAYSASADGHPVTVAIFDHPANLRHPARMFTMTTPFAYLASTLNLWKEPLTLKAGQQLDLTYGVALWDGQAEAAQIEPLYRRWTALAAGIALP